MPKVHVVVSDENQVTLCNGEEYSPPELKVGDRVEFCADCFAIAYINGEKADGRRKADSED